MSHVSISHWISTTRNFFLNNSDKLHCNCTSTESSSLNWTDTKTPHTQLSLQKLSGDSLERETVSYFRATRFLLGVFSRTNDLTAQALSMISQCSTVRYPASVTCAPTPVLILFVLGHSNNWMVKLTFPLPLDLSLLLNSLAQGRFSSHFTHAALFPN